MDELGVDMQILYPTIFIQQVTDRAEVEVALCRSYNQWVAELTRDHLDRLRWICVLPLLSMTDALEQLEWCRQRGAVGVFMRGVEGVRLLHDPYFYPLYDAASRASMAIGVHVGNANTQEVDLLGQRNGNGFWRFRLAIVGACHSLLMSDVPLQFPHLRFGSGLAMGAVCREGPGAALAWPQRRTVSRTRDVALQHVRVVRNR
jgi:predicted TIM-barrel fold metal-dependent hydrolase